MPLIFAINIPLLSMVDALVDELYSVEQTLEAGKDADALLISPPGQRNNEPNVVSPPTAP